MKDKLLKLKDKAGIPAIARKVGVREATIYRWLHGVNPHGVFKKKIDRLYKKIFEGVKSGR